MPGSAPDPRSIAPDGVPLEVKRAEARKRARLFLDFVVDIWVGDDRYPFRAGDVTALHVEQLRTQCRCQWFDQVLYLVSFVDDTTQPVDLVAQLLFLARLQAGDRVTYAEVAGALAQDSDFYVHFHGGMPEAPEEVAFDDPPASDVG